jgi:O-antigen ligase
VITVFFTPGPDGRLGDLVFYDANDFALIMICSIPFAVLFLQRAGGTRRRLLGLVCLGMFVAGIVKSGSRGGFLGLIAVSLYVLLRYRAIPARVRLFAAVAGVALFSIVATGKYWDLIGTILHPQEDYNWSSQEGRREVWKRGVGYMLSRPVLGVGVAAYPTAEGMLSEVGRALASQGKGFKWSVAHNSFIETGAELGVIGLGVFIAIIVVALRSLARISPAGMNAFWVTPREMALAQLLIGALFGFVVAGFFVSAEYFAYLYFLFGLTIGLQKIIRLRRRAVLATASRARSAPR